VKTVNKCGIGFRTGLWLASGHPEPGPRRLDGLFRGPRQPSPFAQWRL